MAAKQVQINFDIEAPKSPDVSKDFKNKEGGEDDFSVSTTDHSITDHSFTEHSGMDLVEKATPAKKPISAKRIMWLIVAAVVVGLTVGLTVGFAVGREEGLHEAQSKQVNMEDTSEPIVPPTVEEPTVDAEEQEPPVDTNTEPEPVDPEPVEEPEPVDPEPVQQDEDTFPFPTGPGQTWPSLVGMSGEEAKRLIEEEGSGLTVIIVPPGGGVSRDFRFDRVFLYVDDDGLVTQVPGIGR